MFFSEHRSLHCYDINLTNTYCYSFFRELGMLIPLSLSRKSSVDKIKSLLIISWIRKAKGLGSGRCWQPITWDCQEVMDCRNIIHCLCEESHLLLPGISENIHVFQGSLGSWPWCKNPGCVYHLSNICLSCKTWWQFLKFKKKKRFPHNYL